MANGNTLSYIGSGIAVIVIAAALLGSFAEAGDQGKLEVTVAEVVKDVAANTAVVQGIDVMQKQVDTIEENVGKILDKLNK